jgi:hypothetical protein
LVLVAGLTVPEYFFFPLGLTYLAFGVVRFALHGLAERPDVEPPALVDDAVPPQENVQ